MKKIAAALATSSALIVLASASVLAQVTTPTLKVVTTGAGQTIYGQRIPILFATENVQLVDYQKNPTNIKGQGHIHVWLDEKNPSAQNAKIVTEQNTLYTDVPYGDHTLKAELVNNNHSSMNPPVVVNVTFKSALATSPTPAPVSSFDKNTAVVILVVVALVIIAAWWYTKEDDEKPAKSASEKPAAKTKKTVRKRTKSRK